MNLKTKTVIVEVISALLIVLFVYAAFSKIIDYERFRIELGRSPILSPFAGTITIIVPSTEIVIAFMLVNKKSQYLALHFSFSLMIMFSAYIWIILKFSSYVPCSCGGILENMNWTEHLIFNIGFVLLSALATLISPIKIKTLSAVRGKAFVPITEGI